MFDILDESICLRNIAHKLKVVDIDFSPLKYLILTASVDAYLKIWSYNQSTLEVDCKFTLYNDLGPICGAGFLNMSCTAFCVVTVDELDVRFYKSIDQDDGSGEKKNNNFEYLYYENLLYND